MPRTRFAKFFIACAFFIWAMTAAHVGFCRAPAESLCVLSLESGEGKRLFSKTMRNGAEFAVRFMHSVAKSPVTDFFIVRDGKIFLDKTVYHDFGAGLPHAPEKGQSMRAEHGEITITGFDREIPDLEIRIGREADHTLLIFNNGGGNEEIPLASLGKPGSVIIFKALPRNK